MRRWLVSLRRHVASIGPIVLYLGGMWGLFGLMHLHGLAQTIVAPSRRVPLLESYWAWIQRNVLPLERLEAAPGAPGTGLDPFFLALDLAAVALGYVLLVRRLASAEERPPLVRSAALALLAAVPLFLLPDLLSSDLFHYVALGRVAVVHGGNPLVDAPGRFPSDAFFEHIFWRDLPSVYGPVWIGLSALLTRVAEALGGGVAAYGLTYKALAAVLHVANAGLVRSIAARRGAGRPAAMVPLYLLNPLALIEFVGMAHNDVLMLFFVLLAVRQYQGNRWAQGAAGLAAAVLTKWFALFLAIPLAIGTLRESATAHARGVRVIGSCAVALGLAAACFWPYWRGMQTFSAALEWPAAKVLLASPAAAAWRFGTDGIGLEPLRLATWIHGLTRTGLALATLVAAAAARDLGAGLVAATWLALVAAIGVPVFSPWYATWPLAISCVQRSPAARRAAVLFSLLALQVYPLATLGTSHPAARDYGVALVCAAPLLDVLVRRWRRRGS